VSDCAVCGFRAADYTDDDLRGTLRAFAPVWRAMTQGVDATPVLEHAVAVRVALGGDDSTENVVTAVDKAVARMLRADRSVLEPAVHAAVHHQRAAGRALHALGAGAPTQHGRVVQVNASGGGVPKSPLPDATVGARGVEGDTQAERLHHGKPMQAVSLWSADLIDALRAEGHSVYPGAAGENLTVAGIDWQTIRPGVQLQAGDALLEISAFATPCVKNAQWFADRNFRRIDHHAYPGWSRAYAWVCRGGPVAPRDEVIVEPGDPTG
jgi:MOSC domain-containing protein YiiM